MSKNKPRISYVEDSNLPPCNFVSRTNHSAMDALIPQKQEYIIIKLHMLKTAEGTPNTKRHNFA